MSNVVEETERMGQSFELASMTHALANDLGDLALRMLHRDECDAYAMEVSRMFGSAAAIALESAQLLDGLKKDREEQIDRRKMTFTFTEDLHSAMAKGFQIDERPDGIYIDTPFTFADGDMPVILLERTPEGWRLSDRGTTFSRVSQGMNDSEYNLPENQRRIASALSMSGITESDGVLTVELPEDSTQTVFNFIHALLKIEEITDFPNTE